MDVLYYNCSRKLDVEKEFGVIYVDLDILLKMLDFVLLIMLFIDEMYYMMGEWEFRLMKDMVFFVNIFWGKMVDEKVFICVLQEGWIKGVGLDVFEKELVLEDNLFLQLENVILFLYIGLVMVKICLNMFI